MDDSYYRLRPGTTHEITRLFWPGRAGSPSWTLPRDLGFMGFVMDQVRGAGPQIRNSLNKNCHAILPRFILREMRIR
jgi:hypothetical protein